jgi:uncharacterized protein (TIGR02246 family)
MIAAALPALEGWDSFYVIIGSSAAALTGLMFVVIALMPSTRVQRDPAALDAYATPTIVHFCGVLILAAFLTIPRHTLESLRACLLITGGVGVTYAALAIVRSRRQRSYTPQLEDWIWHAILPVVAYLSLFIASLFLLGAPSDTLVFVAASALLLLFIGIHNAWDAAVWMTTAGEANDEQQIRAVIERWQSATKAGDLDTILGLMAGDVVFLTPGNPPMTRDAFITTFRGFAGRVQFEAKQDIKEIRVSGELASCWSYMTITMDGTTRAGNILSVFRKVDGKWVLSRDANFVK